MRRLAPLAIIAAVAALLWAPTLALSAPGDSFGYDLEWSTQFTGLLVRGQAYPRWLASSMGGLGAPTFYFYPPLPFYVAAGLSALSMGQLSAALALKLAALGFLLLSGWGAYAWLRGVTSPARAVGCAAIYMAAPYHFDDLYVRAAFAEFAAAAFLPLLVLGVRGAAEGKRQGPVLLTLAYAALILSHLPLALLASVFILGPYALFMLWRVREGRLRLALALAAALAVGVGLAAPYLAPALGLQHAISAEYWWSAAFRPERHLLVDTEAWRSPLIALLGGTAAAECALTLLILGLRPMAAERTFWAFVGLAVFALIAGLVPSFWSLPLVSQVQFPWRAMAVMELAFVGLLALTPALSARRLALLAAVLVVANPAAALVVQQILPGPRAAAAPSPAPFAPEYLPQGALRITSQGPDAAIPLAQLEARPLASDVAAQATEDPVTGEVRIRLSPGPARPMVLRRFYFPSWRVVCDGAPVAAAPSGPARLLSFITPPGSRQCAASIAPTPQEIAGWSLAAAALVAFIALIGFLTRRGRAPSPMGRAESAVLASPGSG